MKISDGRGREIFRPQNHNSPARSGCPHARSATDEGQDWASFAMRRRFFCASELWFLRLHFRRSWWKSSLVFSCFILPSLFFLRLWDLEGKNKKYYREIFPHEFRESTKNNWKYFYDFDPSSLKSQKISPVSKMTRTLIIFVILATKLPVKCP